jgi:hypothetical protein
MELIYHYTVKEHLIKILDSGELIVSQWEKKNNVKPAALWLSLNPVWEKTASKQVKENGNVRQLTKEEQHQNLGLIRFVLEFKKDTLCSWAKYKHKSNTPIQIYESMEQVGLKEGADPNEWYVSFKNIPVSNCISYQEWNGKEWVTIIDYTKS